MKNKDIIIDTNYHTHCYLCKHATGTIEQYFEKAKSLHYKAFGMSDHMPLPDAIKDKFHTRRMSEEDYKNIYLPTVTKVKEDYKTYFKAYSALESEYFHYMVNYYPKYLKELDYLILGQHYIEKYNKENELIYYSIYLPLTKNDLLNYKDTVIEAMNTGYFKILAHPDIFIWGYKVFDNFAKEITNEIIQCAIKNDVVIEMNANGIRNCILRKKQVMIESNNTLGYSYPNYDFWKYVSNYPVKIMINDDSHQVINIQDDATRETYQMANELGIHLTHDLFQKE